MKDTFDRLSSELGFQFNYGEGKPGGVLLEDIATDIRTSDLVFYDTTTFNLNVGLEVGISIGYRKPISIGIRMEERGDLPKSPLESMFNYFELDPLFQEDPDAQDRKYREFKDYYRNANGRLLRHIRKTVLNVPTQTAPPGPSDKIIVIGDTGPIEEAKRNLDSELPLDYRPLATLSTDFKLMRDMWRRRPPLLCLLDASSPEHDESNFRLAVHCGVAYSSDCRVVVASTEPGDVQFSMAVPWMVGWNDWGAMTQHLME